MPDLCIYSSFNGFWDQCEENINFKIYILYTHRHCLMFGLRTTLKGRNISLAVKRRVKDTCGFHSF